ncbi:MAG TPA: tRNA glutamyl-Q(34) synthetase GluQRS [Xanthomonadales bacterium]|nr:tRNA glutamyl-Q(34) synthetase GluQRS [Xanthomonadales bacterium]
MTDGAFSKSYRGRFAPSPSGPLHLGSLLAALASWADARAVGGNWLIRMEDLDPPREQPGADGLILDLLEAAGLVSDEAVLRQSTRQPAYGAALVRLLQSGMAFECRCSRSDLALAGGIHRGACVAGADPRRPAAIRLRVPDAEIGIDDRVQGHYRQNLLRDVGDFVLRRADGPYAYQLAAVVDDAHQGITDVVRGSDLLESTPRQVYLQRCLGLSAPRYAHIPVLVGADGHKLSKQNLAPAVAASQIAALLPDIAHLLGQDPPEGVGLQAQLAAIARNWRIDRVPRQMTIQGIL